MRAQKFLIYFLTIFSIISFVALPFVAGASPALDRLRAVGGEAYGAGTAEPNVAVAVGNIISIALGFVGLVFLVLMLYAGFLWMTAGGEEQKITKAKDMIKAAVIGLVIVLGAYGITHFVVSQVQTNIMSG